MHALGNVTTNNILDNTMAWWGWISNCLALRILAKEDERQHMGRDGFVFVLRWPVAGAGEGEGCEIWHVPSLCFLLFALVGYQSSSTRKLNYRSHSAPKLSKFVCYTAFSERKLSSLEDRRRLQDLMHVRAGGLPLAISRRSLLRPTSLVSVSEICRTSRKRSRSHPCPLSPRV